MAEGLQNNKNITTTSLKSNTPRTSPALAELKKENTVRSYRSSKSLKSVLQSQSQSGLPTSNNNNNNTNNSTAGHNSTKRNTVLKSIRNLFVKASINLSIAASRLKSFAEDALSSDEIVNELFLVTSSSSVDSSLLEIQEEPITVEGQTTNQQEITGGGHEIGESESRSAVTSDMTVNSSNELNENLDEVMNGDIKPPTYKDFDAVAEAKKLHKEKGEFEPFIDGDKVWLKRREAWLYSTSDERTKAKQKSLENTLVGISKDNYPIIYNSLIEKQKTLKKPMNLKDALKVINAGWIASKKWERASQGLP